MGGYWIYGDMEIWGRERKQWAVGGGEVVVVVVVVVGSSRGREIDVVTGNYDVDGDGQDGTGCGLVGQFRAMEYLT